MKNEPQPHHECAPILLPNENLQDPFGVVLVLVVLLVVHQLGTTMTRMTALSIPNLASFDLCWWLLIAMDRFVVTGTDTSSSGPFVSCNKLFKCLIP